MEITEKLLTGMLSIKTNKKHFQSDLQLPYLNWWLGEEIHYKSRSELNNPLLQSLKYIFENVFWGKN